MERIVMDIDQTNFWPNLLIVIETIARADFVAFDLEMTGFGTKTSQSIDSFTQHLYDQAKEAAKTFNILQVGISCASYDDEVGGTGSLPVPLLFDCSC
jgi:hypothetical protein